MPNEDVRRSEERLTALEEALKVDSRLQAIEALIGARTAVARPWWKDAKTVTILGALIAAVLPLLSLINNSFASYRESKRVLLQQQEDIRQKYLDRVLRAGVTEPEQQKVFGLLARFSSDAELQQWAQDELKKATNSVELLNKRFEDAEHELVESKSEAALLRQKAGVEKNQRIAAEAKVAQAQAKFDALSHRLGSDGLCEVRFASEPSAGVLFMRANSTSIPKFPDSGYGLLTPDSLRVPFGNYEAKFYVTSEYQDKVVAVRIDASNCFDAFVFAKLEKAVK